VPSYTDRILFHSLADVRTSLSLLAYEMCDAVTGSDHRPVSAAFALKLNKKVSEGKEGGKEGGGEKEGSTGNNTTITFPFATPLLFFFPLPSSPFPPSLPQVIGFRTLPSLSHDSSSSLRNASSFRGKSHNLPVQLSSYLEGGQEEEKEGEEGERMQGGHPSSSTCPPAPLLGSITPASEVRWKEKRKRFREDDK